MILIGQYDSPFVRRVGIALTLYGLPFRHEPWSSFGDADRLRAYNPLTRVPTLVLDDGSALIESHAILDYLDGLVPPDRALFPRAEPARRRALRFAALATGLGDKAVSLVYERVLRKEQLKLWVERCEAQIGGVLAVLVQTLFVLFVMYYLFRDMKLVTEPATAASTAALLGPLKPRLNGKKVGLIVCGANIDAGRYSELLARGQTLAEKS